MNAGSLTGGILTLFGTIAGGALIARGIQPELALDPLQAWLVYIVCFGAGMLTLLMFTRTGSSAALQGPGILALLLGLIAGAVAVAKLLGLLPQGASLSLWALCALSLPPGVLLLHGASALRNHPELAPK